MSRNNIFDAFWSFKKVWPLINIIKVEIKFNSDLMATDIFWFNQDFRSTDSLGTQNGTKNAVEGNASLGKCQFGKEVVGETTIWGVCQLRDFFEKFNPWMYDFSQFRERHKNLTGWEKSFFRHQNCWYETYPILLSFFCFHLLFRFNYLFSGSSCMCYFNWWFASYRWAIIAFDWKPISSSRFDFWVLSRFKRSASCLRVRKLSCEDKFFKGLRFLEQYRKLNKNCKKKNFIIKIFKRRNILFSRSIFILNFDIPQIGLLNYF